MAHQSLPSQRRNLPDELGIPVQVLPEHSDGVQTRVYKVVEYSRLNAIRMFGQYLDRNAELIRQIPSLTGKRLVCHCAPTQSCHADALIRKFRELCPDAYDRNDPSQRAQPADELNLLARHRQEPPSDEGSSADEGAPTKNSGWV